MKLKEDWDVLSLGISSLYISGISSILTFKSFELATFFKKKKVIIKNTITDNPIRYMDPTGEFEIDAATAAKYPKYASFLKNLAKDYAAKPTEFKKAFKQYSHLSDAEIKEVLTYGKGPKIEVKDLDSDYSDVNGRTKYKKNSKTGLLENLNGGKGLILIDDDVVNKLEKAKTVDEKAGAKILVESTTLHETTHYGDIKKDGKIMTDDKGNKVETGKKFEKAAYGKDVNRGNANQVAKDNKKKK